MRALLAPGVALMNRLRYPQKFALVSFIFASTRLAPRDAARCRSEA
jgi:hypothetical protein